LRLRGRLAVDNQPSCARSDHWFSATARRWMSRSVRTELVGPGCRHE
jgi:hypothetical protein